ncbi:MAG: hypothetical protein AEth_01636 [Candidatus Argoarchaeum ethanivorans]|uniref:PsbP C-terminal domain-containing protein n=1 Tax=Candidatus Argoarchaeum ethanivorans TaxID=2608793 RepID=A0A8B3S0M7_9EURY|nr:MAG: hypothetical protein AEth_01636 [Candidatus Argoarchaeum ethanivorans]
MPEFLGYLTGILLIAYLFIHFGWKWVKRESPKSNKTFAILIIMFLLFGFMVGMVGSVYQYAFYEYPDEYEPIPFTPVPYQYEKYGFSFTCPPDVMNILEEGYLSEKPDENSGGIEVTNDKGTKSIYITWLTATEPELLYPLKDTLKETMDESMKLEGVSNVKVEEIKTITINEHQGVYAPLSYIYYGLPSYDIYCMWYCDQSQRLYYVGIDTYSSEETNELFNEVVDSFVCH